MLVDSEHDLGGPDWFGMLAAIGIIKAQPFNPDAHIRQILDDAAKTGYKVTMGPMVRQKEPTILNGSEVRMGTIQFYAENAEMCYRAWPDATRLAFVTSRERLLQSCIDHLDKAPYLPSNGIVTIEPKSPESDDCNRGALFAL